jgi:hypothetical protein
MRFTGGRQIQRGSPWEPLGRRPRRPGGIQVAVGGRMPGTRRPLLPRGGSPLCHTPTRCVSPVSSRLRRGFDPTISGALLRLGKTQENPGVRLPLHRVRTVAIQDPAPRSGEAPSTRGSGSDRVPQPLAAIVGIDLGLPRPVDPPYQLGEDFALRVDSPLPGRGPDAAGELGIGARGGIAGRSQNELPPRIGGRIRALSTGDEPAICREARRSPRRNLARVEGGSGGSAYCLMSSGLRSNGERSRKFESMTGSSSGDRDRRASVPDDHEGR